MAAALMPSSQYMSPHSDYFRQARQPQPPPSPPMEDSRCSLPSISKLLGIVDAGSPTNEAPAPAPAPVAAAAGPQTELSPRTTTEVAGSTSYYPRQDGSSSLFDGRPASSSYAKAWQQPRGMPPTPPMGTDTSFDGYVSPMTKPVSLLGGGRFFETTPPLEGDFHRHSIAGDYHRPSMRAMRPVVRHQSYSPSPFQAPAPLGSYYHQPAPALHPQISSLHYQQPLPQGFHPLSMPVVVAPGSGPGPWQQQHHHPHHPQHHHQQQHHHYLNPTPGAGYAPSQDRYVCQTCNKAFSRPSSLRIHSHSHTGEKPFKCPHAGCGKAFSVRSNMKRHERGCHNFDAAAAAAAAAAMTSSPVS